MTGYDFPVALDATANLIEMDGTAYPVGITWGYRPADPWAVQLTIRHDDCSVTWSFARSLLAAGVDRAAGVGDVQLEPRPSLFGGWVAVALSSPEGECLLEVQRPVVARFLRSTYLSVPRGQEDGRIDWDAVVAAVLAKEDSR